MCRTKKLLYKNSIKESPTTPLMVIIELDIVRSIVNMVVL